MSEQKLCGEKRQFWHIAYLNDEGKKTYGKIWPNGNVPVICMIPTTFIIENNQVTKGYLIYPEEMTEEQVNLLLDNLVERLGHRGSRKTIRETLFKHEIPIREQFISGAGTNHMGLFLPDFPDDADDEFYDRDDEDLDWQGEDEEEF